MLNSTLKRTTKEIHDIKSFLNNGHSLRNATVQNIDFTQIDINWHSFDLHNTVFLGCTLKHEDISPLYEAGALVFPNIPHLPYKKYRSELYTWQELYELYKEDTVDFSIYKHFSNSKYNPSVLESLCQRLHDHAIDDALRDYLMPDNHGDYKRKCIGVMGGHSTLRTDPYYVKVAHICRLLAQEGYTVVSGGGPGIMEATNLGAYFAKYSKEDLDNAIATLQKHPHYTHEGFHDQAMAVIESYPDGTENVAVPTWFYGHEPSNVFASHIAKYFSNSIREDTLLALCIHGILFAPGSAGTTQEIFMDAAQNHYGTFDHYSPMIFLGRDRYEKETALYPTLQQLAEGREYASLLHITDEVDEAIELFLKNPPIKTDQA